MTMKTLLDDAAAQATADRQINLTLVLERAENERLHGARVVRLRGGVAFLAVAAVIALIAVLLPVGSLVRGEGIPASEPSPVPAVTGIPATWYYAPVWTPPVTRHPMNAAVMVLSAPLRTGSPDHAGRGPVLVSADAKTYATLPNWGADDGGVTLIADGTKVAWWTAPNGAPVVVHLLTLKNGIQHDVTIDRLRPSSMIWRLGDVFFSGRATQSGNPQGTYRISADGRTRTKICGCAPDQLGTDSAGSLLKQTDERQGNALPSAMGYPATQVNSAAEVDSGGIAGPALITSPDGGGSVSANRAPDGAWTIKLQAVPQDFVTAPGRPEPLQSDQTIPVKADEPVQSVKILGWTSAGIILQVNTSRGPGEAVHRSIRVMDPRNGRTNIISRAQNSQMVPVGIAPGLVPSADPIASQPVSFSAWDRSHLRFLAALAWNRYRFWIVFGGGAVVALIAGALVIGRTRRHRRHQVTATATDT